MGSSLYVGFISFSQVALVQNGFGTSRPGTPVRILVGYIIQGDPKKMPPTKMFVESIKILISSVSLVC